MKNQVIDLHNFFQKLNINDDVKKEHIFVAGYSDGQVYLHSPSSDLASSWRYDTSPIYLRFDIHCISYLQLAIFTYTQKMLVKPLRSNQTTS